MWKDDSVLTLAKVKKLIEKSNGDLNLGGNQKYSALPEGLEIPGNLVISNTRITSIPKNTKVMGNLYASSSLLSYIHPSVRVLGNVIVDGTKLKEFPEHINDLSQEGKSLDISNTNISEFPYKWRGKVYAKYSKIKEIKGRAFQWAVDLAGTPITELPEAFFYDVLDVSYTKVTKIPEKLFAPTLVYYDCDIADEDIPQAIINRIH